MNILITGGTGYIGSHTALQLALQGHHVVLFDNLSNSTQAVLRRLALLGGEQIVFEQGDVRTSATLAPCLLEHDIDAVIHLAGSKGPAGSFGAPLDFHSGHMLTTFSLLRAMAVMPRPTLVYGSTAAVYGQTDGQPLDEHRVPRPLSPYASAHHYAETVLSDLAGKDADWSISCLRLFNVAGAHPSGLIGEECGSTAVGLATRLARLASGHHSALYLQGHRLNTPDGSPQRDFVHVMDVAQAHVDALAYAVQRSGFETFNIGSGQTHSVRALVQSFESLSGQAIRCLPGEPTPDEPSHSQACLQKSRHILGWEPIHDLQDVCHSAWNHLLTAMETGSTSESSRSLLR